MDRTSVMFRLDVETRAYHPHADAPWMTLLSSDLRHEAYIRHLVLTYGFEAPVESVLMYTASLRHLVTAHERTRSGLLAQDLIALGLTPAQVTALPQCFSIVEFDDAAEALGWLYVIERTTMYHEAIRRHVVERLPTARSATAYLSAAQHNAKGRWCGLAGALEELASAADRVIRGAEHAFRRLYDWHETGLHDRQRTG